MDTFLYARKNKYKRKMYIYKKIMEVIGYTHINSMN